jgi:hypothetical protein
MLFTTQKFKQHQKYKSVTIRMKKKLDGKRMQKHLGTKVGWQFVRDCQNKNRFDRKSSTVSL